MTPPPLSGWTLPVPATFSFLESAYTILGFGGAPKAILRFMLESAYPEGDSAHLSAERIAVLNPLYPYHNQHYGAPQPVDYVFLQQFRSMLDVMYGPRGGYGLARRIGRVWWSGERPIDQVYAHTSWLSHQLSPTIRDALVRNRGLSCPDPFLTYKAQRLWVACQSFAEALGRFSGITCACEVHPMGVVLAFSRCPFCANDLPMCGVLVGVIEALLVWLYQEPNHPGQKHSPPDDHVSLMLTDDDTHRLQITLSQSPPTSGVLQTG